MGRPIRQFSVVTPENWDLAHISGSGANSVIELAGDDAWGHRLGEGVAAGRSGSGVAAAEVLKITIWRLAA
jgi:hypothetical protein